MDPGTIRSTFSAFTAVKRPVLRSSAGLLAYSRQTGGNRGNLDFGISVQSWDQFEQLRAAFLASGQFEKDPNPSVFWSRRPGRLQVDLVPFGAIQKDDGSIAWPPEERQRMNVLGYEAALRHAWRLPLPTTPPQSMPLQQRDETQKKVEPVKGLPVLCTLRVKLAGHPAGWDGI